MRMDDREHEVSIAAPSVACPIRKVVLLLSALTYSHRPRTAGFDMISRTSICEGLRHYVGASHLFDIDNMFCGQ